MFRGDASGTGVRLLNSSIGQAAALVKRWRFRWDPMNLAERRIRLEDDQMKNEQTTTSSR